MGKPKADEIQFWIELSEKHIKKREKKIYNNEASPATYTGKAMLHIDYGCSKFLRGDDITSVRIEFKNALSCIEKSFEMVFDSQSSDFLGEGRGIEQVTTTLAIDGLTAALLAGDFDHGRKFAQIAVIPPDEQNEAGNKNKAEGIIGDYMLALKKVFLGKDAKALEHVRAIEAWFEKKGEPKKKGFRKNFFHRARMVRAILENNPAIFNTSMKEQLADHAKDARYGDISDTPEAYVYIDGVALCNLARYYGILVDVEADTIPKGLLID